jgi:RNA polymerase sigma-70 factor (ECF subfamily)
MSRTGEPERAPAAQTDPTVARQTGPAPRPAPDAESDEDLVARYVSGDQAAFRTLFDRYAPVLLRMASRHLRNEDEARDVVQQTFVQVHAARFDFQQGRPFRPWLFTIGMNVIRQVWRRRKRTREVDDERAPAPVSTADTSEPLLRGERARLLREALSRLPTSQREVVELHWFQERPFAEVARMVGSTEGAVKVRAHRAYTRLRHALGTLSEDRDD